MDLEKIKEQLEKFGIKKNLYNLVIVFLVGILLLVVTSFFKSSGNVGAVATSSEVQQNNQSSQSDLSSYELAKKNELKYILGKIEGVGQVDVMINFASGDESVPAINETHGTSSTNEKDNEGGVRNTTQNNDGKTVVMTNNGNDNTPFILKKLNPQVAGVIIVAEGADDTQVKYKILNAVTKVFELPANKVEVLTMKK